MTMYLCLSPTFQGGHPHLCNVRWEAHLPASDGCTLSIIPDCQRPDVFQFTKKKGEVETYVRLGTRTFQVLVDVIVFWTTLTLSRSATRRGALKKWVKEQQYRQSTARMTRRTLTEFLFLRKADIFRRANIRKRVFSEWRARARARKLTNQAQKFTTTKKHFRAWKCAILKRKARMVKLVARSTARRNRAHGKSTLKAVFMGWKKQTRQLSVQGCRFKLQVRQRRIKTYWGAWKLAQLSRVFVDRVTELWKDVFFLQLLMAHVCCLGVTCCSSQKMVTLTLENVYKTFVLKPMDTVSPNEVAVQVRRLFKVAAMVRPKNFTARQLEILNKKTDRIANDVDLSSEFGGLLLLDYMVVLLNKLCSDIKCAQKISSAYCVSGAASKENFNLIALAVLTKPHWISKRVVEWDQMHRARGDFPMSKYVWRHYHALSFAHNIDLNFSKQGYSRVIDDLQSRFQKTKGLGKEGQKTCDLQNTPSSSASYENPDMNKVLTSYGT